MYIAMNRFKVAPGSEAAFEEMWTSRETHLKEVPGFKAFHLLRGATKGDHTLYASHSVWESHAAFEAWTKSEAFRKAHANAGTSAGRTSYLEAPELEGFEVLQEIAV